MALGGAPPPTLVYKRDSDGDGDGRNMEKREGGRVRVIMCRGEEESDPLTYMVLGWNSF